MRAMTVGEWSKTSSYLTIRLNKFTVEHNFCTRRKEHVNSWPLDGKRDHWLLEPGCCGGCGGGGDGDGPTAAVGGAAGSNVMLFLDGSTVWLSNRS